jgi:TonB family protein
MRRTGWHTPCTSADGTFLFGGELVSFLGSKRWLTLGLLMAMSLGLVAKSSRAIGAEDAEITRKVKTRVTPMYPEIARRMNISGVVKLVVVVSPNGSVKSTKVLGGHPLLVSAAEDAVKKWKFETSAQEDSGVVEFTFRPEN